MALDLNDKTSNGNTLTNVNTATEYTATLPFSLNNVRGAGLVRTSSQYLYAADSASLEITGDITIEMWVRLASLPSTGGAPVCFSNKGATADSNNSWRFYCGNGSNNLLGFEYSSNGLDTSRTAGEAGSDTFAAGDLNNWHHIAVTVAVATKVITLYKDGTSLGTITNYLTAATSIFNGNGSVGIGAKKLSTPVQFLDGQIDDVRIYNTARTAAQIALDYNKELTGIETNLVAYWPFESLLVMTVDGAGNSGDQAAASSYSGSASWVGTNRMLAIDVSMLGAGVTVTAMTYGGANCTLVGVKSTVTSFGRVEQWIIKQSDASAPAAGANTLAITLSGSLEFSVEWVSYTGVHQTSPTEGFNSAQATNAGSATDASVAITTVADNDWVHAAVVANDTSITAGNTTRNNISGTLGSGANEDNGAPKTPAGSVTMSYTNLGITTTWAIAGYALRDINASTLTTSSFLGSRTLLGVGF